MNILFIFMNIVLFFLLYIKSTIKIKKDLVFHTKLKSETSLNDFDYSFNGYLLCLDIRQNPDSKKIAKLVTDVITKERLTLLIVDKEQIHNEFLKKVNCEIIPSLNYLVNGITSATLPLQYIDSYTKTMITSFVRISRENSSEKFLVHY